MTSIPFWKMSGAGNDFILIDNRQGSVPSENLPALVARLCRRRLSVGADGLILIQGSDQADFKWQFFNSDGSVPEMCGNGARCAARFANLNGIAGERMTFETVAGVIGAQIKGDQVSVNTTDPQDLIVEAHLNLDHGKITYGRVNTGVPHVVVTVDDIERAEVVSVGRQIRNHAYFAPAGTNVNFIAPLAGGHWAIRTYERGVEDETLACGTGVAAAALILAAAQGLPAPIALQTRSGSILKIYFSKDGDTYKDIFLEGDARIIYKASFDAEAWEY